MGISGIEQLSFSPPVDCPFTAPSKSFSVLKAASTNSMSSILASPSCKPVRRRNREDSHPSQMIGLKSLRQTIDVHKSKTNQPESEKKKQTTCGFAIKISRRTISTKTLPLMVFLARCLNMQWWATKMTLGICRMLRALGATMVFWSLAAMLTQHLVTRCTKPRWGHPTHQPSWCLYWDVIGC